MFSKKDIREGVKNFIADMFENLKPPTFAAFDQKVGGFGAFFSSILLGFTSVYKNRVVSDHFYGQGADPPTPLRTKNRLLCLP